MIPRCIASAGSAPKVIAGSNLKILPLAHLRLAPSPEEFNDRSALLGVGQSGERHVVAGHDFRGSAMKASSFVSSHVTELALNINGRDLVANVDDPEMPLLYFLRNELDLRGPRFGCGLGQCGACMVDIDGVAVRSCIYPIASVHGKARGAA